jgi:hypothetical protein
MYTNSVYNQQLSQKYVFCSYVEKKPAETQISIWLASHLVRGLLIWRDVSYNKFKSPASAYSRRFDKFENLWGTVFYISDAFMIIKRLSRSTQSFQLRLRNARRLAHRITGKFTFLADSLA